MALSLTHALTIPIKHARFSFLLEWRDSAGALTNPTSPDTEVATDGSSFTDCAEEVSPTGGFGYITLTGAEMNNTAIKLQAKGTGVLTATADIYPVDMPVVRAATAQAGATGTITLDSSASAVDDYYNGCWVRTTGGTGGGGVGGLANQARLIIDYVGSTKVATIQGTWETNPGADTTFDVLAPPGWFHAAMARILLALPAAAPDAAAGLPVSDAGGLDMDAILSRIGTPTNLGGGTATLAGNMQDIEAETDDIGVAGAGLTAIPWNPTWDVEVESEVNDALVVQRLDELVNADSDIDGAAPPAVGSVFHELLTKTAGSFTYDQSTDSLEALRDTAPMGTAMRGTDNAALASVCTEARLAELDAANLPTDAANIQADTDNIQTRIPAALVSGRMDSDVGAISSDATAADNLESEYDGTGYGHVLVRTTIATLASQTSFTLTAGSADNDAYNGCVAVIQDATTAAQKAVGVVSDYVGATKTITLLTDPAVFTMAATDIITIIADRAVKATVDNRTLDVSTGGEAGVDWANVGTPGSTVALSATTIKTATDVEVDTANIQTRLPAALVGGRMDSDIGAKTGNVALSAQEKLDVNAEADTALADVNLDHVAGTATGIPAIPAGTFLDQIMDDGIAVFDRTTDSLQAVRDVTALASVCTAARLSELDAANLPTDVANVKTDTAAILLDTGTDGVVIATGAITAAVIATGAIDADALAADAGTELADAHLKRDLSAVTGEAARSPLNALRLLRNKWSITGGVMTVTKEDDSTSAWTTTLTEDANANPVTASDPA